MDWLPHLIEFAVVTALLAFLWWGPEWQGRRLADDVLPKDRASLVNEYRRTVAQIIGGIVLLAGLFFSLQQYQLSQQQYQLTESGQTTDRFSKAVAQLGEPDPAKIAVRLGGVYALERLMLDSPRDHRTIFQTLAAFVRTSSSRAAGSAEASSSTPADVQAALNILGDPVHRQQELGRLDLRGSTLPAADLSILNLNDADLRGANLSGTELQGTKLARAKLIRAHLEGARLAGADLFAADLTGAYLTNCADLTGADLRSAILKKADIKGADFTDAQITREQVTEAIYDGSTRFPWVTTAEGGRGCPAVTD